MGGPDPAVRARPPGATGGDPADAGSATAAAAVSAAAAVALVAVITYFAYGRGYPNSDARWTLAWAREPWAGDAPSYDLGPTPHPLTNLLAVALAPLGRTAEAVLHGLGFVAVGALIVCTGLAARDVFTAVAGVAAALLLATRDALLFNGALAYLDVLFAALLMIAFALLAGGRRREAAVLPVLAVAGLVRPEAWVVAGCFWLYRAREPGALRRAGWVLAAPVLWAAGDLLATGDPLFSFTSTREATPATGRPSGLDGAVTEGWRVLAQGARPAVCVLAAIGLAMTWRAARTRLLAGALAVTYVATLLPVVAGTPLNERYLLPTIALTCIAAAGTLQGLAAAGWRRAVAVGCLVLLAGSSALHAGRLLDRRAVVVGLVERRDDARAVVVGGLPCRPLVVPHRRLVPFASVWARVPPEEVADGAESAPARGSYVWGTPSAMNGIVTLPTRPGAAGPEPAAPIVRRSGGWRLRAACAA